MSECISFFPDFVMRKHYFLYFDCMFFVLLFSRGFKKVKVHIRQVPMENPLSLPPPLLPLRPLSLPLAF